MADTENAPAAETRPSRKGRGPMPGTMGWRQTKIMYCCGCGRPMYVNIQKRKAPRCADCGLAELVRVCREISLKSGPAYERWLAAGGARGRPKGRG